MANFNHISMMLSVTDEDKLEKIRKNGFTQICPNCRGGEKIEDGKAGKPTAFFLQNYMGQTYYLCSYCSVAFYRIAPYRREKQ